MKEIIIAFITCVIVVVAFLLWLEKPEVRSYEKELMVGAEQPLEGYCLRNTITGPQGEVTIEEQAGGKYDYQVIATTRGIEVWVPCE